MNVAISLHLSPSKAEGIYKQYSKLRGLHDLLYLYKKVGDISLLSRVHEVVKKYNLGKKQMINIVEIMQMSLFF